MHVYQKSAVVLALTCWLNFSGLATSADNLLIDDFESDHYQDWIITGNAFGESPAVGTLANQMPVSGYRGNRLVNTFYDGDGSVGTATSSNFTIQREHIAFMIGGGSNIEQVGIELLIDGRSVRASTGSESEELLWTSWDVGEFRGEAARIRIYDQAVGGWGHINIDQLIQTDSPPPRFDLEHQLARYRQSSDYLNEPFRPQVHFSPEIHWMNDPNGLVYFRGEYHLFYQYNPAGNTWGHMSWGHAVSRDLMHWQHLPLAIAEEDGIMAFSGCCVVDEANTSGFGDGPEPPLVAVYTGHGHGKQVQNLAFSNDRGRTWTKYDGNPVIDLNSSDFRDPKVFWHEPTGRWVMVVSLPVEKVLVFYSSNDLKNWTELSRFGPAGVPGKLNWECPDLFELPVEGSGEKLWVLEADMGSGSVAGGSGGEYFVGHFDGTRFTSIQESQWVDYGRDFYAPVSWSNLPKQDGRRIWIGWLNNWETCLLPTFPWRSCMSIPRDLHLRAIPGNEDDSSSRYVLVQRPVRELNQLKREPIRLETSGVHWPPRAVSVPGQLADMSFVIDTVFQPGTARSCGIRIRTGDDAFTEIGFDRADGVVYVDRRHSGNVTFHASFPGRHEAPTRIIEGQVALQIIMDRSSIEVFINEGEAVISDRLFPSSQSPVIEAFAGDETAQVVNTTITPLQSIWHR